MVARAAMTVADAILKLDQLEDADVLFARRPWSSQSDCIISRLDAECRVPQEISDRGLDYFIEVSLAREVLGAFGGRTPSEDERLRLLLHYAEYDAYPEWAAQP